MHTKGTAVSEHTREELWQHVSEGYELAKLVVQYFGDGPIDPMLDCDIRLRQAARDIVAKAEGR
jgi:hypothetical protein